MLGLFCSLSYKDKPIRKIMVDWSFDVLVVVVTDLHCLRSDM